MIKAPSVEYIRLILRDGFMVGREPLSKEEGRSLAKLRDEEGISNISIQFGDDDACLHHAPIIELRWNDKEGLRAEVIFPWEWEVSAYVPVPIAIAAMEALSVSAGIDPIDRSEYARLLRCFDWKHCKQPVESKDWILAYNVSVNVDDPMAKLEFVFVEPGDPGSQPRQHAIDLPTRLIPVMFRGVLAAEKKDPS